MDINTIEAFERPRSPADLGEFQQGDAWVAGGTWLFSEPQPQLRRLISTDGFDWPALSMDAGGLTIAATCKIAELDAVQPPLDWHAAPLIKECCRAFLASFKIWNMATVGGNLCMSLPAGPMISLCASLDGICEIWARDGSIRMVPVLHFVRAPVCNALRSGELLRSIFIPSAALKRKAAFRRAALAPMGRTGALVIGTAHASARLSLTVTGATPRPVRLEFETLPDDQDIVQRLAQELPFESYYDDVHGTPDWRQHMTREFALEIARDLRGDLS